MKIYIGSDHAGFELKEILKDYLPKLGLGYEVVDKGAFSMNADDDYPDFIHPTAVSVVEDKGSMGVVIGGSGEGEAIDANRVPGARAVVFYGPKAPITTVDAEGHVREDQFEIIKLAREHNDANILSLAARFVTVDEAKFAVELFLKTQFSGDERHERRIEKLDQE